jgi:hypothetical protein
MNNTDLGRVHAYLLHHRYAETKSVRRNVSKEERDIATMLRDAEPDMRVLLREILEGQGLALREYNEFDVKGIPVGATVFAVVRLPDTAAPVFGQTRLLDRMKQVRGIETDLSAKVWFVQIWFVCLDILYTRRNRSPSEMQGYVDSVFSKDVLVNAVKSYINDHVRKLDKGALNDDSIYKILSEEKGNRVLDCCRAFLDLMVESGLLEQNCDNYRQTILSACEMKLNFDRQLASLLPSGDPISEARTLLVHESASESDEV